MLRVRQPIAVQTNYTYSVAVSETATAVDSIARALAVPSGITTVDTIISRIAKLLRAYLDTELDFIDARNNALAATDGDAGNYFDTPSIASDDVQTYQDQRAASGIRVVVEDGGMIIMNDFQRLGHVYGTTAPQSILPRIDRRHRIDIRVSVATAGGADTFWSARLKCNRVGDAVEVIMARFSNLGVPSSNLEGICYITEKTGDTRASEIGDDTWQRAERVLSYDVRTIETRA